MSLNESPVDVNIMARVHSHLSKMLMKNESLIKVLPLDYVPSVHRSDGEKHSEYWVLKSQQDKPWIFVSIGQLYFPIPSNSYVVQVVATVPKEVWQAGEFSELEKKLNITEPDSPDRDFLFENYLSSEISKNSYAEGVVLRESGDLEIRKCAMRCYINIISHLQLLLRTSKEITKDLTEVMEKYKGV